MIVAFFQTLYSMWEILLFLKHSQIVSLAKGSRFFVIRENFQMSVCMFGKDTLQISTLRKADMLCMSYIFESLWFLILRVNSHDRAS